MRLDLLLLLMVFIWGSNYSIVKSALTEVPPIAFNAVRLAMASAVFLAVIATLGSDPNPASIRAQRGLTPDLGRLLGLSLVGHTLYQLLFIAGLANTSAANSSLIIGCTPVFVALMTAALRQETITRARAAGIALSAAGIYLVIGGRGAVVTGDSVRGDLMMLGAVFCWSAATIIARPLLARHAAIIVTGSSMAIGTVFYIPFAWRGLVAVSWRAVSVSAWAALVFSALFALCVAYVIWYTALQRLGNTRTAIYSNMVPVAGLLVAWLGYGEPIGLTKIGGAALVLTGVFLTRL